MRRAVLLILALTSAGWPAHAGNAEQAARMKACAEEWRLKQQAGTAKGEWRAFSKQCLKRPPAGTARPAAR